MFRIKLELDFGKEVTDMATEKPTDRYTRRQQQIEAEAQVRKRNTEILDEHFMALRTTITEEVTRQVEELNRVSNVFTLSEKGDRVAVNHTTAQAELVVRFSLPNHTIKLKHEGGVVFDRTVEVRLSGPDKAFAIWGDGREDPSNFLPDRAVRSFVQEAINSII